MGPGLTRFFLFCFFYTTSQTAGRNGLNSAAKPCNPLPLRPKPAG